MHLILNAEQRTIIQQYGDCYNGRWWVGRNIWYSKDGLQPRPVHAHLAVPNATAHPSAASVPTEYYSIIYGTGPDLSCFSIYL